MRHWRPRASRQHSAGCRGEEILPVHRVLVSAEMAGQWNPSKPQDRVGVLLHDDREALVATPRPPKMILVAVRQPVLGPCAVLAGCGLRVGEAVARERSDVGLLTSTIFMARQERRRRMPGRHPARSAGAAPTGELRCPHTRGRRHRCFSRIRLTNPLHGRSRPKCRGPTHDRDPRERTRSSPSSASSRSANASPPHSLRRTYASL